MSYKLINIDDKLWTKFGKKCKKSGKTIRQSVTDLIQNYLGGNNEAV